MDDKGYNYNSIKITPTGNKATTTTKIIVIITTLSASSTRDLWRRQI